MNEVRLTSTELKRNTAKILNSVAYGGSEVIVERYGEPVVKIVPMRTSRKRRDFKKVLDKHFGSIPDFPDVAKMRYSRKRAIHL